MRKIILGTALLSLTLASPLAAQAQVVQGTANGAQRGADEGAAEGGPIGGIVGGAIGAGVGAATGAVGTATGIVGNVLGVDDRPRFHRYVVEHREPSYAYDGDLRVGTVLPERGVEFRAVPEEFRVDRRFRYGVVNDRTVIVDPRSRRVVEIID